MTTNHAAAAATGPKRSTMASAIIAMGLAMAGCSSGGDLLGGNNQIAAEQKIAPPSAPAVNAGPRIAIAPVIGAPEAIAQQLTQGLTGALEQQKVALAKSPADKADYTLRGYVVAAKDKAGTKLSYIWDVTDGAGKRINRITGEETAEAAPGKDPWATVSAPILQSVANKTATSLAAWLPSQSASPVAASTPAGVGAQPQPIAAATPAASPKPQQVAATSQQPTGSIGRDGGLSAVVPSVTGAPGDGSSALTGAIQRELTKSGVAVSDQSGQANYRVEGRVKIGAARDGKQPIQIDWDVKDAQGKKLGTVSQKNDVPQGSLDGAWGNTADAAAAAAAQGILKLMPAQKATN